MCVCVCKRATKQFGRSAGRVGVRVHLAAARSSLRAPARSCATGERLLARERRARLAGRLETIGGRARTWRVAPPQVLER